MAEILRPRLIFLCGMANSKKRQRLPKAVRIEIPQASGSERFLEGGLIGPVLLGAGGGLGLPIIGRLLGHAQAATTARYAHLDNDPLQRASEAIAVRIAAALEGNPGAVVVPLRCFR